MQYIIIMSCQALDEKVRERLRISIEKNAGLEEELDGVREELHKYKASGAKLPEDSIKKVQYIF